ncbi:UPF0149 family protein [Pseudoalteromonas sp. T1lg76]|uniref:UPF0149 family protein n=1 Tax=Pseudoalteromonas sp. T1lg76 TaxID=2077103 RepID=UPI000CF6CEF7|nr:UPF0149 family protein [Pseudoalteromonas sp. T1lg76]
MSEQPSYQQAQLLLESNDIFVMPAEVQGIITGLLACGLDIEEKDYLGLLSDVLNDGISFEKTLKQWLSELYSQAVESFSNEQLQFELMLPDEEESLIDQANALVAWVNGFLLGFGLKQKDYGKLSDDVKEVIQDFTEISRLDTHFDETEEDKQALHEVLEYVRVSAMLCFAELGKRESTAPTSKTLH